MKAQKVEKPEDKQDYISRLPEELLLKANVSTADNTETAILGPGLAFRR